MDAIGAHQGALDLPRECGSNSFQVRLPGSLGFVIGVAHVVANGSFFAANRTASGHF
jgi:hypothetical protein